MTARRFTDAEANGRRSAQEIAATVGTTENTVISQITKQRATGHVVPMSRGGGRGRITAKDAIWARLKPEIAERRLRVLMLADGTRSGHEIATELGVSLGKIDNDLHWLRHIATGDPQLRKSPRVAEPRDARIRRRIRELWTTTTVREITRRLRDVPQHVVRALAEEMDLGPEAFDSARGQVGWRPPRGMTREQIAYARAEMAKAAEMIAAGVDPRKVAGMATVQEAVLILGMAGR